MLKKLQHHINIKIQRLLDKMIIGTIIFMVVAFGLMLLYAITHNSTFIALIWILGLIYSTSYFMDAFKFGSIVNNLDQESLTDRIYLSKSYFNI